MSRIRNVGGKIIEKIGGDYKLYSASNITYQAGLKIQQQGKEGVVFGTPEIYNHTKTCLYTPNAVAKGDKNYYIRRFTDFMNRHASCNHIPPVYYYGLLKELNALTSEEQKEVDAAWRTGSRLPDRAKKIENEIKIKRQNKDSHKLKYAKNGKVVVGTPEESYGYKYCEAFTKLKPRLSKEGQKWLDETLNNLQLLMERGVVDKYYIAVLNTKYNVRNRLTEKDGKTPIDKNIVKKFYTNIELNNTCFKDFAFATHPDAYNPKRMEALSTTDLAKIIWVPEMKEFLDDATWEQAYVVVKNINVKKIGKAAWEDLKKYTKESVNRAEGKVKEQLEKAWDQVFNKK